MGKSFSAGQAYRLGASINHATGRMVLQIFADSRQIAYERNIKLAQMLCRTHTREHEQLRRSDRPGTQNDFPFSPLLYTATFLLEANNRRTLAFKINAEDMNS